MPVSWIYNITDASGGGMSASDMENNVQLFIDYFTGYMTAEAMAGILGNMQHESYLNPAQCQIGSGTSSNSNSGGGLIQWTPRSAFVRWCEDRGRSWYDGYYQLYRIRCEGEGRDGCSGYWLKSSKYGYYYSWSEFCQLTDYEEACKAYLYERERAGNEALSLRLEYAQNWYDFIQGGQPIPTPSPTPDPPEPRPYEYNMVMYGGIRDLMRRGVITNGKL